MKICPQCKTQKRDGNFGVRPGTSYLRSKCKQCEVEDQRKRDQTKQGVIVAIYRDQIKNSKRRGHQPPTYTKEELTEWLYSQPKFHRIYDNWKRLDFQKDYRPSIDRKENDIGYTMANIQIMTWKENDKKERIKGKKTAGSIAICQYSLDSKFIKGFISAAAAAISTGIGKTSINNNLRNKSTHAGGFLWEYAHEVTPYEKGN